MVHTHKLHSLTEHLTMAKNNRTYVRPPFVGSFTCTVREHDTRNTKHVSCTSVVVYDSEVRMRRHTFTCVRTGARAIRVCCYSFGCSTLTDRQRAADCLAIADGCCECASSQSVVDSFVDSDDVHIRFVQIRIVA